MMNHHLTYMRSVATVNGTVTLYVNFNSVPMWKDHCYAIPKNTDFDFRTLKQSALNMFRSIDLINMFQHHSEFLVFKFHNCSCMAGVINRSPLEIEGGPFHLKSWPEHVSISHNMERARVWVELGNVHFRYGYIHGLFYIAFALVGQRLVLGTHQYRII